MKKVLAVFMLAISLIFVSGTAMADTGIYNAGASNPDLLLAGQAGLWGTQGYWDLTNVASIPDGAKVTSIYESWRSQYPNTGLRVALFKADGNGYYTTTGANVTGFKNQPVKQKWSTACTAQVTTWIWPVLTVQWSTDTTTGTLATEGVTTISPGQTETSIVTSTEAATLAK